MEFISWDLVAYFGAIVWGWILMEYLKKTFFPTKEFDKKKTPSDEAPRRSDIVWHGSASAPEAPKKK
jgi:hypothetical protein